MKREVIQELLNLPGVEAIAITTRKMRPVFYGFNQKLDDRHKLTLGQGILQVFENTAEGFEVFEFYFLNHTVFIYKQTSGLVLLVIVNPDLELKQFHIQIDKFRLILEQDIYSGVTLFKQISGNTTQSGIIYSGSGVELSSRQLVSASSTVSLPESPAPHYQEKLAQTSPQVIPQAVQAISQAVQPNSDLGAFPLQTWIDDLNKIGTCAAQYLGKMIAGNYWKSTRSPGWLEEFQIDRNAHLSHPKPEMLCDQGQDKDLQKWAVSYVQQCKQVIRNFDLILQQKVTDSTRTDFLLNLLKSVNAEQKS